VHCTRIHQIFIDLHPGNNCVLFIELFTNRHVSAIKKKIKKNTVFLFQLLQFDYEAWEIIICFTTCFSFWRLCYIFITYQGLKNLGPPHYPRASILPNITSPNLWTTSPGQYRDFMNPTCRLEPLYNMYNVY
jgi:hypothetical protein